MPSAKDIQAAMVGVSKDELFYIIDQYVHSERDRALMKRRLHDRVSIETLSEEFEMSPRRCFEVVKHNRGLIIVHLLQKDA